MRFVKRLLVFIISLSLVIAAYTAVSGRPDGFIQVFAGRTYTRRSVNVIQLVRGILGNG